MEVCKNITKHLCQCLRLQQAHREHGSGEETPCEELQKDDHHGMVNTGLTDSLGLDRRQEAGVSREACTESVTTQSYR